MKADTSYDLNSVMSLAQLDDHSKSRLTSRKTITTVSGMLFSRIRVADGDRAIGRPLKKPTV